VPRHIAGVHDVQPGIAQRRRAAAGGDQLDALRREELAELHEALLVRHREQRALHLHDIGGLHRVGEARRLMARAQSRAAGDTRHHSVCFKTRHSLPTSPSRWAQAERESERTACGRARGRGLRTGVLTTGAQMLRSLLWYGIASSLWYPSRRRRSSR
jgi:hypothetical protein